MKHRSKSYIEIKRESATIKRVLISPKSTREFSLMQRDCIKLDFSLDAAVHFAVGDYIDDELFGRFVITFDQMPQYNKSTAGYDYSLQFDAPYLLWKNWLFMLTTTLAVEGERIRKESEWSLTDRMSVHIDEIINNLSVIGETYTYSIDESVNAAEVHNLTYKGASILDALSTIAETWSCEWWIRDNTIYFGKCEDNNSPLQFRLGHNVESMTVQKNINNYCNKLYAFGSTKNIPQTYRRNLWFTIDSVIDNLYTDTTKPLELSMIVTSSDEVGGIVYLPLSGYTKIIENNIEKGFTCGSTTIQLSETQSFVINGTFYVAMYMHFPNNGSTTANVLVTLDVINNGVKVDTLTCYANQSYIYEGQNERIFFLPCNVNNTINLNQGAIQMTLTARVDFSNSNGYLRLDNAMYVTPYSSGARSDRVAVSVDYGTASKQSVLYLENGDTPYNITLNPQHLDKSDSKHYYFSFNDGVPSGFGIGSKYTIIDVYGAPYNYYDQIYTNPSALTKIGENRLQLPLSLNNGGGYVATSEASTKDKTVEMAVAFENVYPRCVLKITDVTEMARKEAIENADGSTSYFDWTQYTIKARNLNGNDFPFRRDFIKDGMTLQASFITEMDEQDASESLGITPNTDGEYRLAGMTFDVGLTNGGYTLVRNENYGAKLPNEELRPKVGDALILVNWDVRAMARLGLVEIAENTLRIKAEEYLSAIEQGQFTFTCEMMSDWLFSMEDFLQLKTSDGDSFIDSNSLLFFVKNDNNAYALPINGAKVSVYNDALKTTKTSRIIGYEFKLDKPYDTPKYIVGETDAYSRLKKIEKQITRLGNG